MFQLGCSGMLLLINGLVGGLQNFYGIMIISCRDLGLNYL